MTNISADQAASGEKTILGHPRGLVILFFTEMWERFSYYGMRGLLILYLTQHFLFSDEKSSVMYGAYTALVYIMTIVGGTLAGTDLRVLGAVGLHLRDFLLELLVLLGQAKLHLLDDRFALADHVEVGQQLLRVLECSGEAVWIAQLFPKPYQDAFTQVFIDDLVCLALEIVLNRLELIGPFTQEAGSKSQGSTPGTLFRNAAGFDEGLSQPLGDRQLLHLVLVELDEFAGDLVDVPGVLPGFGAAATVLESCGVCLEFSLWHTY